MLKHSTLLFFILSVAHKARVILNQADIPNSVAAPLVGCGPKMSSLLELTYLAFASFVIYLRDGTLLNVLGIQLLIHS